MLNVIGNLSLEELDMLASLLNEVMIPSMLLVWIGVFLESEKWFPASIREWGWRLLVVGLGAETLIAVMLPQIESAAQAYLKRELASIGAQAEASRAQIAEANTRTAQAQRDLAILRGQTERRWPQAGGDGPVS